MLYPVCGLVLLIGGRFDRRSRLLGAVLVLLGAFWAQPVAGGLGVGLYPELFLPAVLWWFVREFPRVHRRTRLDGAAARMAVLAAAVGGVLQVANLPAVQGLSPSLAVLAREVPGSYVAPVFFGPHCVLVLSALVVLLLRVRGVARAERARTLVFAGGIVAALAPHAEGVVEVAFPGTVTTAAANWVSVVASVSALAVPCLTLYAAIALRVLDVRTTLRVSARRLLTRGGLAVLTAGPLAALGVLVASRADLPVRAVLADPLSQGCVAASAVALAALAWRERLLANVDAWVAPETAGQRRALASAGAELGQATGAAEVEAAVARAREPGRGRARRAAGGARAVRRPVRDARRDARSAAADVDARRRPGRGPEPASRRSGGSAHGLRVAAAGGGGVGAGRRTRRSSCRWPVPGRHWPACWWWAGVRTRRGCGRWTCRSWRRWPWRRASRSRACRRRAGRPAGEAPPARGCRACGRVAAASDAADRCESCGGEWAEAPVPALVAGKFVVERRIGAGGMGTVYRARDAGLDRIVAIKALDGVSPEGLARLQREGQAMAAPAHPAIAQVHGLETWRGRPLLVMEHLDGGTLTLRLARGPLAPAEAVRVTGMVAEALDALHAAGYRHGDVKPSNIGFAASGAAKLLDFGLAERTGRDRPLAGGTVAYLSPEALGGAPVGAADDVWALGVVLYEMAAGRRAVRRREASTRRSTPSGANSSARCRWRPRTTPMRMRAG